MPKPRKPSLTQRYREAARARWHRDGEIEIDDNAKVSLGDDPGAYVQAWVWVVDAGGEPPQAARR